MKMVLTLVSMRLSSQLQTMVRLIPANNRQRLVGGKVSICSPAGDTDSAEMQLLVLLDAGGHGDGGHGDADATLVQAIRTIIKNEASIFLL